MLEKRGARVGGRFRNVFWRTGQVRSRRARWDGSRARCARREPWVNRGVRRAAEQEGASETMGRGRAGRGKWATKAGPISCWRRRVGRIGSPSSRCMHSPTTASSHC